VVGSDCFVGGI